MIESTSNKNEKPLSQCKTINIASNHFLRGKKIHGICDFCIRKKSYSELFQFQIDAKCHLVLASFFLKLILTIVISTNFDWSISLEFFPKILVFNTTDALQLINKYHSLKITVQIFSSRSLFFLYSYNSNSCTKKYRFWRCAPKTRFCCKRIQKTGGLIFLPTLKEKQTPNPNIFRCLNQLSKNVWFNSR